MFRAQLKKKLFAEGYDQLSEKIGQLKMKSSWRAGSRLEGVLPKSILRRLTDEEMAVYRAPFAAEADRQPTLNWPRQIPIAGEPPHIVALVQQYADWLKTSLIPKLFVNADPGSILVGRQREFCRSWPNQREVTVPGLHFIQEDSGAAIGQAVAAWLTTLG